MAVEIPVYIDISGAFDRAVSEIPKEAKRFEDAFSKRGPSLKISFDGEVYKIRDLLTDTTLSADNLKNALRAIQKEYEAAIDKGKKNQRTSAKVNDLAKAYGLVQQRLTGVYNASEVASMRLQDTIAKVSYRLDILKKKLSKQTEGSEAFNKTNYQIKVQEQRLLELNKQIEYYRIAGRRAGTEVSRSMQGAASSMMSQTGLLGRLAGLMGSYLSIAQLGRFVKQIRDVTGELEYQRVALGHLLQDEEYGAELFERIKAAAVESPFRITQLVTYTKQLAAYRIEQENLFDTTKRLADISAGLGVDMNRLILAFGQVRAASVLRGQELRQFTESGIPLVELLADKFTELKGEMVSTADVFKLISERAVPFSMIADIFEDLTDKGGMFYKMQEEQAKTLKGRWEKLKDAYDIALQSIGDSESFQRANDAVLGTLNLLAKYLRVIPKAINGITASFLSYLVVSKAVALWNNRNAISESKIANQMVRRALLSGKLTLAEAIRARQSIALAKAEGRLAAATNGVSRAMAKLNIALIKNPWVAAIAAVVGLVVAFTSFKKKADETASSMHDIEDAIEGMSQANKAHTKIDGLIDRYERLSSKAERSADETLKLTKTTSRLKEELPGAIDVIDNQNLSLEEQARLLREINDAELERQRADKEEELDRAETRLKTLQGDMQSAEQEYSRLQKMYLDAKARAEKGAAAINAEYAGTQTRTTTQKELDRAEAQAEEAATSAHDAMSSIEQEITKLTTKITRLRNQLYPEEAKKARAEWQNLLIDASKYTSEGVTKELFPSTDVESWNSLGEAIGKLKQQFKDAKTTYEGLVNSVREGGNLVRPTLVQERDAAKDTFDAWQLLDKMLGGLLSAEKPTGRDTRLSQLKSDISELTNAYKKFKELTKYKGEQEALIDLDAMFPQLKGWTPTFDSLIDKLNNMLADVREKLARSPKSKTLLDMQRALETEISNLRFDKLKTDIEQKLARLSDEIKRSEAARNFYHNILDLTGDEKLAATMSVEVYGGLGNTFQERMQQQLNAVLGSLDASKITDELRDAFANQNFSIIMANLDKIPEAWHKQLKDMADSAQKFSADQIQTWLKELQKDQEFADKRVQLARQMQERIAEINRSNLPDDEKQSLISQYVARESKEVAKLQYEAFKNSPMYIALFEDLDAASSKMLENMRTRLIELKSQWSNLDPVQLKEMQKRLDDIDAAIARRNPFKALGESIKAYRKLLASGRTREGDEEAVLLAEQNRRTAEGNLETAVKDLRVKKAAYEQSLKQNGANSIATALLKQQYDAQNNIVDALRKAVTEAKKDADTAQENANEWTRLSANVRKSIEGLATFSQGAQLVKKNISDIVDLISEMTGSDGLPEAADLLWNMAEATSNAALGFARVLAGDISGAGDLLSAKMSGIQIILQAINMINNIQLREWDTQMESQNKILTRLQRTYDDLGDAIDDAFGSDYLYNYNEMLKNLAAQQEAYAKQQVIQQRKAREASKEEDRKAAAEEADNLAQQIEDTKKKAKEVTESMKEFFAGTSVTAAAEAFADAWLDAYREFGSTTDAIKAKMEDMIRSLVVKSAMAGAVEAILSPWFDKIKEYADEGSLTNAIPELASRLMGLTGDINEALSAWANVFQSQGVNLRQTAGRFTGIAHEVAGGKREESILALAAGINTQNFYMSYVPTISTDVHLIAEMLSGGSAQPTATAATASAAGTEMPSVQEMIHNNLPDINRNLADIKQMLSEVIKPSGTSASKYVATRI